MSRILVLYYSQSGEVTQAVKSFVKPLETEDNQLVWECIKPKAHYPYPWKNVYEMFDIFPECINQEPPEIEPPSIDPDDRFDLVILAYQVWFLAPSLPVQGFLKSNYARVLRDTRVITLVVCRNMWHSASETMKQMIAAAGGQHIDNVVVTYKGPPLATLITTPRKLLTGRRERFLGLPEAEARRQDITALGRFGQAIADNLDALRDPSPRSLLKGLGAVQVNPRYAVMERAGWYTYHYPWAKIVRFFGQAGSWQRRPVIYLFVGILALTLPLGVVLAIVLQVLLYPLLHNQINAYIHRLKSPSGVE